MKTCSFMIVIRPYYNPVIYLAGEAGRVGRKGGGGRGRGGGDGNREGEMTTGRGRWEGGNEKGERGKGEGGQRGGGEEGARGKRILQMD